MSRPRRLLPLVVALAALLLAPALTAAPTDPPLGAPAEPALGATDTVVLLRAAKPAWLTPDLEARVLAADGMPVAAPLDAPLPGWVGIRPGSWIVSPAGCTTNFVFERSGDLGIGTAGHCADVGDDVILLTLAPGAENPVLVNIGRVTFSVSHEDEVTDDFALIDVRASLYDWVSPTIAVVGGPCGTRSGGGVDGVFHYGHGLAVGTGGTPRAGLGLYFESDMYYWTGVAAFGDSGSAVRVTDLRAAGNLTHLVVDTSYPGATTAGTTIDRIHRLISGWTMLDSPLCGGTTGGGDATGEPDHGGGGGDNGGGPPDGRGGGPPPDRGPNR